MKTKNIIMCLPMAFMPLVMQAQEDFNRMPPPPMGQDSTHHSPMAPPPGGFMHEKPSFSVSKKGISITKGNKSIESKTYTSSGIDENAILVSGGTLNIKDVTVNKNGSDSNNSDATSFYGTNAAVLAKGDSHIYIIGGNISTTAIGANGIVAYGGSVDIKNTNINCEKNLSRGIHATGGGTINATNLHITTKGNNSSVIATDRGGGTITVDGGTYSTSGRDCAVCYSTGCITVNNITGVSEHGEVGVIEGDNEININNCTMTSGDNRRGLMILQSGSGDALGNNGKINITGGNLTLTDKDAPLIEITTSTQGTLTLKDAVLNIPSGILMKADYNKRWQTTSPIANLVLTTATKFDYTGNIVADKYAVTTVKIDKGVIWNGAYNTANTAKSTSVKVDGVWNLTADSYVDNVTISDGGQINKNGFQLITK